MDIRTKTLLSLGVIFTLFLGLILGISVSLFLDELQALDNSDINADVQRGLNALANEQEDLAATLHDWAYWDDTYRFAQDQNPEYILQNLNANSFDSLRINVLLVTDPSGIPVYSQHFQSMGMQPPKWQNVNDVMLFALSHVALESVAHDFRVEGLEIYVDSLLENVFSSLFENSLVHGNVKSVIRSWFQEDEHGLILYFEDDGDGVPPDRKELIFSKGSGTAGAVGLFLSREILSITGITIAETGEFKKGARFEIRVPKDMYRIRKNGNPQEM